MPNIHESQEFCRDRDPDHKRLRRGDVAKLSGLGSETIRYYEKIGLLPDPARSRAGYREYSSGILLRLRFIQSAKKLGFSLDEIAELLALRDEKDLPCSEVRAYTERKIEEIDQKIRDLQWIRDELDTLLHHCGGNAVTEKCAIIHSMEGKPVGFEEEC